MLAWPLCLLILLMWDHSATTPFVFVLSKDLKFLLLPHSNNSLLASRWLEHTFLAVVHPWCRRVFLVMVVRDECCFGACWRLHRLLNDHYHVLIPCKTVDSVQMLVMDIMLHHLALLKLPLDLLELVLQLRAALIAEDFMPLPGWAF